MAEQSFSKSLEELAISFEKVRRELAFNIVQQIVNRCSRFKIGKTGESPEERLSQPDYCGVYQHIEKLYRSSDKSQVDEMEASLIDRFSIFPHCDNVRGGIESMSDRMREDALEYCVYIVWND